MCNIYGPAGPRMITERFRVAVPAEPYKASIGPWGRGPVIRLRNDSPECVVGQWALIADGAREAVSSARIMTNNARSESVAEKRTFKGPWLRGQRCLIPADHFQEPNWESGRNVWWRFRRTDGSPLALAGLWNDWADPATGEILASYTMLTMNCDGHPLLARMHKPDPKLPADRQDKRSVVPMEEADWEAWLHGSVAQAAGLLRVPPLGSLSAGPAA
jgi:putative SOS response-associated peptidase YedK